MDLLLVALLLFAVAAVVAVALGAVRGGMAPADGSSPPPLEAPVSRARDLDRARFALALRGYRMDQVDAVLDEARDLLLAKDEEIDRLRALAPDAVTPDAVTPEDVPVDAVPVDEVPVDEVPVDAVPAASPGASPASVPGPVQERA